MEAKKKGGNKGKHFVFFGILLMAGIGFLTFQTLESPRIHASGYISTLEGEVLTLQVHEALSNIDLELEHFNNLGDDTVEMQTLEKDYRERYLDIIDRFDLVWLEDDLIVGVNDHIDLSKPTEVLIMKQGNVKRLNLKLGDKLNIFE